MVTYNNYDALLDVINTKTTYRDKLDWWKITGEEGSKPRVKLAPKAPKKVRVKKFLKSEYNFFAVRNVYVDKNKLTYVVAWLDGTKTKLKCKEDDIWDEEKAFMLACVKKFYGNDCTYTEAYRDAVNKTIYMEKSIDPDITNTGVV